MEAYIAHHIPGRMRLRMAEANAHELEQLRAKLADLPNVNMVETNPGTRSLLLFYSNHNGSDFIETLRRCVSLVERESQRAPEVGDFSSIAVDLLKGIKNVDDEIRRQSSSVVDLKLLFPLAIVGLAAITLPANLQTPLWLSLLMFGWSSFESMHSGALEQPAGKSSEEHESNAAGGASQG